MNDCQVEYEQLKAKEENLKIELSYYPSKTKKILLAILTIFIIIFTTHLYNYPTIDNQTCYYDPVLDFTSKANEYYSTHDYERSSLLIIASMFVDIIIYYNIYLWAFYATDWILLCSILLFYFIRQILLYSFIFTFPDGYIFTRPIIPSLTVSYYKTNDFFYSGHIGLPIIIYQENRLKNRGFANCIFCLLVCFTEAYAMIVTRGHYTIDLVVAVFMAIYCFDICQRYPIDLNKIFSIRQKVEEDTSKIN